MSEDIATNTSGPPMLTEAEALRLQLVERDKRIAALEREVADKEKQRLDAVTECLDYKGFITERARRAARERLSEEET